MFVQFDAAGNDALPCVVLVHGDFQNHSALTSMREFFKEKGHKMLWFDLPGHGLSPYTLPPEDFPAILKDIIDSNKLQKPILVGHSSGGILAADYAAKTKNASAVIALISPVVNPLHINAALMPFKEVYIEMSKKGFKEQTFVSYASSFASEQDIQKQGLATTDPRAFAQNIEFYSSLPINPPFERMDMPFLIIASKTDTFFPFEEMMKLENNLPNAKVVGVDSGHHPHIMQPQLILSIIEENYAFILNK